MWRFPVPFTSSRARRGGDRDGPSTCCRFGRAQRTRLHRPGNFGFVLTVAATALLAAITYATVILPLLPLAVLAFDELWESYAIFIAVGLLWFAIAWILATRKASDQTGQPA